MHDEKAHMGVRAILPLLPTSQPLFLSYDSPDVAYSLHPVVAPLFVNPRREQQIEEVLSLCERS